MYYRRIALPPKNTMFRFYHYFRQNRHRHRQKRNKPPIAKKYRYTWYGNAAPPVSTSTAVYEDCPEFLPQSSKNGVRVPTKKKR